MRDTAAQLVDARAHLLKASSRRGYHANRAACHAVGKTQPNPVDNGGTTVWTHDQQALLGSRAFQVPLVVYRNVVTVEEHVLSELERLSGNSSGVPARH